MRAKQVKNRGKHRAGRIFLLVLLLTALLLYGSRQLTQAVLRQAQAKAATLAADVLHQAAEDALAEADNASLLTVTKDAAGQIRLVEADVQRLNRLSSRVSLLARQRLAALDGVQLEIPLAAAFSLPTGAGPAFHVRLQPAGDVSAALASSFKAEGINQTRLTVTLRLSCTVRLTAPAATAAVTAQTDLAAAECIIVGEVPQTLLQGGRLCLAP